MSHLLMQFYVMEVFMRLERISMRTNIRRFKVNFNSLNNLRSEIVLLLIGVGFDLNN